MADSIILKLDKFVNSSESRYTNTARPPHIQTLEEMIESTFESQVAAQYIIQKTIRRSHNKIFSKQVDEKLFEFSLNDAESQMTQAVITSFIYHEEDENKLKKVKEKNKGGKKVGRKIKHQHSWEESIEPKPGKLDNLTKDEINIDVRTELRKIILPEKSSSPIFQSSPHLSNLSKSKSVYSYGGGSKRRATLKDITKKVIKIQSYQQPETIDLPREREYVEQDTDIARLRYRIEQRSLNQAREKAITMEKQRLSEIAMEEKRINILEGIKSGNFTYSYHGHAIPVNHIQSDKLTSPQTKCLYSLLKDNKQLELNKSRSNFGISKSTFYQSTQRFETMTPAKEKAFVHNLITKSNFEGVNPSFVGVTVKEGKQTKSGSKSFAEMFGNHKITKKEYANKISQGNISSQFYSKSLNTTEQNMSTLQSSILESTLEGTTGRISEKSDSPTVSEKEYRNFEPMSTKSSTIRYKHNYNIKDLITTQSAYHKSKLEEEREYPKSYIPQLPKRRIKKQRGSLFNSHSALKLEVPRGPNKMELELLKTRNHIDKFNTQILENEYWGINIAKPYGGALQEKKFEKPIKKPRNKEITQSVPSLKKFPREREFNAKQRINLRYPTSKFGNTFGYGIV